MSVVLMAIFVSVTLTTGIALQKKKIKAELTMMRKIETLAWFLVSGKVLSLDLIKKNGAYSFDIQDTTNC